MTLPKTILNIVKVIQKRLEVSPNKDKIFPFSAWDFRDENGDLIPKPVLKSGLRQLAEDERLLRLRNIRCLDRRGRFNNDDLELEVINREKWEKFREEPAQLKSEASIPIKNIPYCLEEGKWGYLKFGKHGEKVKIGSKNGQPFKLLQCCTAPRIGHAKSIDTVFESIRENVRSKSKSGVFSSALDKAQKVKLIEYTIKELQKGNKLRGKLEFKWDELKTKLWLEYTE